ncbi:MAG TPA: NAD(P)H-binding protein [Vicinamibacteria bacterium]|nr:NAD(P)H-binding protein [Vicinamibacteria bacterium]
MTRVLITGGTGVLGRQLVAPLLEVGHIVRISSRGSQRSGFPDEVEWSQTSLSSGEGLAESVLGVDTIVHAASTPIAAQKVDVEGTRALLRHAKAAGVSHVLYISIVGIDGFPFSYYRAKRATEQLIEAGPVPFTILRATQFHELLDERFLPPLFKLPLVAFVPTDLKFQVIDSGEVARRLIELVSAGPSGRVPDVGGPEVLTMGRLSAAWMPARGIRRKVVHLPLPGRAAAAFRRGQNTCPDRRYGRITWSEYLSRPRKS